MGSQHKDEAAVKGIIDTETNNNRGENEIILFWSLSSENLIVVVFHSIRRRSIRKRRARWVFFLFPFLSCAGTRARLVLSRVNGRCRIRRASDFKIDSEQQRCLIFFEAKQIPPNE